MTLMSASVRSRAGVPAVGWSGHRTVTVDRNEAAGGMGLGFNGGELLFLALAACFTNDLYREARRMGVELEATDVRVVGEFPEEGAPGRDLRYDVRVEARGADEATLRRLVEQTDRVAEIHNTLRAGTPVALGRVEVVGR